MHANLLRWPLRCDDVADVAAVCGLLVQVLVEGPTTGVQRQALNFKRLQLTDFKVKISHSGSKASVVKALAQDDVVAKFNATAWAHKLRTRARRSELTDFDRFKVLLLRKQKRAIVGKEANALKKKAAPAAKTAPPAKAAAGSAAGKKK
jgi:large subunit ribosomal protein L14e